MLHQLRIIVLGSLIAGAARAQASKTLPAGVSDRVRVAIEQIADSMRTAGLPVEPIYAKVAEGRLKQATDAQIIGAVRSLAGRFREIRAGVGGPLDVATMTAAATALSVGVPVSTLRDLRDAAAGSADPGADLAGALVILTDLVTQRVSAASAAAAVQSLLARRAPPEQFARLRQGVSDVIAAGRSPDQAARSTSESIVKALPPAPPIRPPGAG